MVKIYVYGFQKKRQILIVLILNTRNHEMHNTFWLDSYWEKRNNILEIVIRRNYAKKWNKIFLWRDLLIINVVQNVHFKKLILKTSALYGVQLLAIWLFFIHIQINKLSEIDFLTRWKNDVSADQRLLSTSVCQIVEHSFTEATCHPVVLCAAFSVCLQV